MNTPCHFCRGAGTLRPHSIDPTIRVLANSGDHCSLRQTADGWQVVVCGGPCNGKLVGTFASRDEAREVMILNDISNLREEDAQHAA